MFLEITIENSKANLNFQQEETVILLPPEEQTRRK
jgi:hypothetical protein